LPYGGQAESLFLPRGALRFAREGARRSGARESGMAVMGSFSIWHWMLFGAVALLLFGGKGKISDIMGDVAKGIKSFKKGMSEDDEAKVAPAPVAPRSLDSRVAAVESNDAQKVN
jgi:sec-independent protein translocase protein TatA